MRIRDDTSLAAQLEELDHEIATRERIYAGHEVKDEAQQEHRNRRMIRLLAARATINSLNEDERRMRRAIEEKISTERTTRSANLHELKSYPERFEAMLLEGVSFDLRLNDRDFQEGDGVILKEYEPATKKYTGRVRFRRISYILRKHETAYTPTAGLVDDYVILQYATY